MNIGLDTLLCRDAGVFYAQVGREGVVMNLDFALYHGLNDVGARIWELLETPHTAAQLCDRLLEEFDVDKPVCQAAVLEFAGKLLDRGIIYTKA